MRALSAAAMLASLAFVATACAHTTLPEPDPIAVSEALIGRSYPCCDEPILSR